MPKSLLDLLLQFKYTTNVVTKSVLLDCIKARLEGNEHIYFYLQRYLNDL